ncbi:NAD-dependent protein deacylase [Niallia sp.]|uniref:NAD-dependent protein deacylase n=1 Tax=Niallia sp. TaxID=2837523 RepID=UPI00289A1132|nr:NAD-dependent protein deacylase [Niallia sp.]
MDSLVQLIKSANYLVVFTGAGMSTESGLPDFRSANRGLWTAEQKQYLSSTNALNDHLQEFIEFYRKRVQGIHEFKPHKGHYILAEWERKGLIKQIITQNVDGFHQEAGNQKVAELHGTLKKVHCEACGKSYISEEYLQENYSCSCGGVLRPSIVLFGEMLPEQPFTAAEEAAINSDVFLVLGSSLSVSPANQFPLLAGETGAKLIIVNKEPTEMDGVADFVIHEAIGSVLEEINLKL